MIDPVDESRPSVHAPDLLELMADARTAQDATREARVIEEYCEHQRALLVECNAAEIARREVPIPEHKRGMIRCVPTPEDVQYLFTHSRETP